MQGFNMGRYVPPDADGLATGNQLANKHPLGARAARLRSDGILTVRFEMPFAVWCDTCAPRPALIGQGVRFNAHKQKVGRYLSSPIYSFRMRHAPCGGTIEIRTDPANTAYVVVAGGRRRHHDNDNDDDNGGQQPLDSTLRDRDAAFAKLERTIDDRAALAAARHRIDDLADASARHWDDPYARNGALRRSFRVGRRARERDAAAAEALCDRMGLGIELLPESDEDARRARLVDFGAAGDRVEERAADKVLARPLFGGGDGGKSSGKGGADRPGESGRKKTPKNAASKMKESLVSEIVGNTRKASDPFLEPRSRPDSTKAARILPGLKRKRSLTTREPSPPPNKRPADKIAAASSALVDYDSD